MEYISFTIQDNRRNDRVNKEIAALFLQGMNAHQIYKALRFIGIRVSKTTVYKRLKELQQKVREQNESFSQIIID